MYVLFLKTDISVTAAAAVTTEVSIFSVRGLESDNGGLRGGFTARSPLSLTEPMTLKIDTSVVAAAAAVTEISIFKKWTYIVVRRSGSG